MEGSVMPTAKAQRSIGNLYRELQEPITSERQVVYILCEIRKVMELSGASSKYPSLYFHCSWALHTSMGRAGAERILKRFDRAHPLLLQGALLHQLPEELADEIESTTALWRFEEEMREFLRGHQLSTDLNDAPGQWSNFLNIYAGIIEDCPIVLRGSSDLRHISSVFVKKVVDPVPLTLEDGECILFSIRWTCLGKDGRSGHIDSIYTLP